MKKYIVCYITNARDSYYESFIDGTSEENLKEAQKRYNELREEETTYSANICEIIQSTDY